MKLDTKVPVKMYELPIIAATRVALGLGIGLLVGDRFNPMQRQTIGKTLTLLGVLSTIPLALDIMKNAGAFEKCEDGKSDGKSMGRAQDVAEQKSWASW